MTCLKKIRKPLENNRSDLFIHFFSCSALEDAAPYEAIQLYTDACSILEEDGKEQMAFDLYRAATSIYIKLEK